jgi:hypothetical protein
LSKTAATAHDIATASWWRSNLSVALCVAALTVLLALPLFPEIVPDSDTYRTLALGQAGVPMPFAARILHPYAVAALAHLLNLPIDTAFAALAFPALLLVAFLLVPYWRGKDLAGGTFVLPILASPVLVEFFATTHMPDLWHMALVLVFLVAARRRHAALAGGAMAVLMMIRESSLPLAGVAVVLYAWRRDWRMMLACGLGTALGHALTAALAHPAANIHRMPALAYMALKIPANFLSNILGIALHTDAFSWCASPFVVFRVPSGLNLGNIHEIGLCAPSADLPLMSAAAFVSVFGLLPGLLFGLMARRGWRALPRSDAGFAIALGYGLLMYGLGTMTGKSIPRLVGYGWPAFLVALPLLLHRRDGRLSRERVALIVVHAVVMWLPYVARHAFASSLGDPAVSLFGIVLGLPANIWAFRLARADKPEHGAAIRSADA